MDNMPPDEPGIVTLALALEWIETAPLTEVERRDSRSAVLATCKWASKSPAEIPANAPALRRLFKAISPGSAGVTRKRLANVRWSLGRLLRLMGIEGRAVPPSTLSTAWTEKTRAIEDKYARETLVRFARYCTSRGIEPEGVCDEIGDAFRRHLEAQFRVIDPRRTHRETARLWNRFVTPGSSRPVQLLVVPCYSRSYVPPWSALHPDLVADLERYLSRHAVIDPFDLSAPICSFKPSTIDTYRDRLRRFAGCLLLTGVSPSDLRSLADLVRLENVERGLRYLAYERKVKPLAATIAILLASVARDRGAPNENVDAILAIASRLRANRKGLSTKTRERLQPLKHEGDLARLFLLPTALIRALSRKSKPSIADAQQFQLALALALLTVCPLRVGSLCSLRIDRHLSWSRGSMRGDLIIEFAPGELKNDDPASFPIPRDVSNFIRIYCERFRPLLDPRHSPFLFCGRDPGKPRLKGGLSVQIRRLIFDRLGLWVNPHLYRHIVHLVVLRRFPGAYGMIARVLTHRSISTTIENYAYLDGEIAMRAYQQLVEGVMVGSADQAVDVAAVAFDVDRERPRHVRR